MKLIVALFAFAMTLSAHAQTADQQAVTHMNLAKDAAIVIGRAQSNRMYKTDEVSTTAKWKKSEDVEARATERLIAIRGLLVQDLRAVQNEDVKHRVHNVIRQIDSMTVESARYGTPSTAGVSRRGVR